MNLSTILILLVLTAGVALIISKLIRDKENGKSCAGCSGNCAGCAHCAHHQSSQ